MIVFINDKILWPNYHKWLEELKDTFQEGLEVTPEQLHGGFQLASSLLQCGKKEKKNS